VTCLPVADVNPQVYPSAERQGELTGCDGRSLVDFRTQAVGLELPPAMDSAATTDCILHGQGPSSGHTVRTESC